MQKKSKLGEGLIKWLKNNNNKKVTCKTDMWQGYEYFHRILKKYPNELI